MSQAIAETRLLHKMHRAATSLLADAAQRPSSPHDALTELRDFTVAALRHHHESEDDVLWPQLLAAGATLTDFHEEHDALDAALGQLADAPVPSAQLATAATEVRNLVHEHLEHEEPVLFPALAAHMPDETWAPFARSVIASSPPVGAHLNIGFFERVGTPDELAAVAANMPPAALEAFPVLREQANRTLESLSA
ncbi:hemerythrin domain-containing protein [Cryptosporangium sp. NPDC048952]|uniref:hemerythrin domain-containing protein n=1 Tax=Cryptosporangium sp. NPDC048952 TaxID=3363961 RepID=UPI0037112343